MLWASALRGQSTDQAGSTPAANAASSASANPAPTAAPRRILFIGNSFTYVNDLPGMVESLIRASGCAPVEVDAVVGGGYSLEDHWAAGLAQKKIQSAHWDVVVLQQGPSSQPEGRDHLMDWSKKFAKLVRAAGATPALYSVWPSQDRSFDFGGVSESYRLAAKKVDGLLLPAGEAWRAAWKLDKKLALYGPDRLHPTVRGSLLAAMVIAEVAGNCPGKELPAELHVRSGKVIAVPKSEAATLQLAAATAVRKQR